MNLRKATVEDIPALLDLIHSAYRGAGGEARWTSEAGLVAGSRTTAELLEADLAEESVTFLVAADAEGLLACCAVTHPAGAPVAYFGTFAVRPSAQGGGIGGAVLAAAEAYARAGGASTMEMTVVVQRSELLAWYARRGYGETGERRPFPYGDLRYGSPLRDDLEFTVLRAPLQAPGNQDGTGR